MRSIRPQKIRLSRYWIFGVLFLVLTSIWFTQAVTGEPQAPEEANVAWLEPNALGVFEVVGRVPEEHLQGAIVRFQPGDGIATYMHGERNGDEISVTVKWEMDQPNRIYCLSSPGKRDEWSVVSGGGTVRIFDGGVDVTEHARSTYRLWNTGKIQPSANASGSNTRYPYNTVSTQFNSAGAIVLPPNMGCRIELQGGTFDDLTATYTFSAEPYINITPVLDISYDTETFVGNPNCCNFGLLAGLNRQIYERFNVPFYGRHAGVGWQFMTDDQLDDIEEANYVLVTFPPTPRNPYSDEPVPGGGTIRIHRGTKNGAILTNQISVDHIQSMLLPIHGQWEDADRTPNAQYLTYFEAWFDDDRTGNIHDEIKSPEYMLPPGIPFDPCMIGGTCPNALLDQVWTAKYEMKLHFYKVERATDGLEQIPLRQVGKTWSPSRSDTIAGTTTTNLTHTEKQVDAPLSPEELAGNYPYQLFIPGVGMPPPPPPPDAPNDDCPCGWFDPVGRMWSFVPAP